MKQAKEAAKELNQRIQSSEEYKTYQSCLCKLKEASELYRQTQEFRRRNHELQNSTGEGNLYDEVFNLVKEYDTILQESVVADFLQAEQRLCACMQDVYKLMSENIQLDYEFLEK